MTYLKDLNTELTFAIISGFLILFAWLGNDSINNNFEIVLYTVIYVLGGYFKTKEGLKELVCNKKLTVEFLMIISAISAAIIGSWHEGAILIFIFAISGSLETFTLNKNKRELTALMKYQPEIAIRLNTQTGTEESVLVKNLNLNDTIIIKPGDRVPADCVIINGLSYLDESTITGESLPIPKKANDAIYAGTINLSGFIKAIVLRSNGDTLLGKIIELVQLSKSEKPQSQIFIDKIEDMYVKGVLLLVSFFILFTHYFLVWGWHESFYRGIILLVVASPCAVVSSIMPAVIAGITNAAKKGILIKGGTYLENLAHVNEIAFDKTGTLTKGTPFVTDYHIFDESNKNHIFKLTRSLEKKSNHPLAKAIVNFIETHDINADIDLTDVCDFAGYGIQGLYNGDIIKIGKPSWILQEQDNNFIENLNFKKDHGSIIAISIKNRLVAVFQILDCIRAEASQTINYLNKIGIETVMLTGDNENTASHIATSLGINKWISKCLPQTKVDYLKKLKLNSKNVAMIGDGINDAPALALADIGITLGHGTDVALETSDIVLIKNDLSKLPYAFQVSKKLNKIIRQNLTFSLVVILFLIIANLSQNINLSSGVLGHEGSTLLVILNGLRLLKNMD